MINKELLTRSVAEVIDKQHLEKQLGSGKKLRVKLGIDPTGSKLHLGHAVVLRILRRFQDLGHTAVLIIGDTTASIGDPSGKNETRPALTFEQIKKNFATYERQAIKILDESKLEIHWQSEWFKKFNLADVIKEASQLSAGWILSHETFRNRLQNKQPLAFHELLYPIMQAYDSIAIKADIELGGMDQKFNLLTGRELMRAHRLEPQDIILGKYLIGTDGQKMGKTLGNFIALEEEPNEMFGKVMSLVDAVIFDYFENATTVPMDEIKKLEKELKAGANPRDIKKRLAEELVTLYHGKKAAIAVSKEWSKVFSQKEKPSKIPAKKIYPGSYKPSNLIVAAGLASSKSEARRLIDQGGVRFAGSVVKDDNKFWEIRGNDNLLIQVGKRKFLIIK